MGTLLLERNAGHKNYNEATAESAKCRAFHGFSIVGVFNGEEIEGFFFCNFLLQIGIQKK